MTAARSTGSTQARSRAGGASTYHHGDLRRALLDAAVRAVADAGPAGLSLRALATEVGVSHAAPVHHFKDKAGLFTAIAIEGFDLLADELTAVWEETGEFLEVGVRYVRFALLHKGHFEVMFRAALHNEDDPVLAQAKRRAFSMLYDPLIAMGRTSGGGRDDVRMPALASWSLVHGLATLVLSGNVPTFKAGDPDAQARHVIMQYAPAN